jgi:RimJ/RimL family protein N-acetyltransferase
MLSKIYNILKIKRQLIFSLDNPNDINFVPVKAEVDITEITFDNVEHVADFREKEHISAFLKFLEEGQYGVYAWIGSQVVGHAWAKVCKKDHCRVNGYMDIYQNEAFIHYCHVSKDYRGKNIYPAMVATLCQKLFSDAMVKRVLIDTEVDNRASLRGISKVGFKPLGKGVYVQFLGRLIYKHEQFKSCSVMERT